MIIPPTQEQQKQKQQQQQQQKKINHSVEGGSQLMKNCLKSLLILRTPEATPLQQNFQPLLGISDCFIRVFQQCLHPLVCI